MIPERSYQSLLSDVCLLYDEVAFLGRRQQQRVKLKVFWEMGQRILAQLERYGGDNRYGTAMMDRLTADMQERYEDGIGNRTLYYIRDFATEFEPDELDIALTWSHYKHLMSVKDEARRAELAGLAKENKWKADMLGKVVRGVGLNSGKGKFVLTPRSGPPGIFEVVRETGGRAQRWSLDLGFQVRVEVSLPVKCRREGLLVRYGDGGRLQPVLCRPGERYVYRGEVQKVVDGDTLVMNLSLGCGVRVVERLRLRGVDAPEMFLSEGEQAKVALERMLETERTLRVCTYGHDRYGRFVADVETDGGVYVNSALVESGYARFLQMGV